VRIERIPHLALDRRPFLAWLFVRCHPHASRKR
jgi:hypothetical protein